MALTTALVTSFLSPTTLALALLAIVAIHAVYALFLHPLHRVPGPLLAKLTPLWLYYHSYAGDEASVIDRLHSRYGSVLRIAPNEIDIKDGRALAPIYVEHGGFRKHPCYRNFDIEGHQTIFSAIDPAHRAARSKAVLAMFAPTAIRNAGGVPCIERGVAQMVQRMQAAKSAGVVLDTLDLSRRLAVDAVSGYLFGEAYGGLSEDSASTKRLSASAFVDSFVAVGRFFLLPQWAFYAIEWVTARLPADKVVTDSMARIVGFTNKLAAEASTQDGTYQGRLKEAGILPAEISIQCQDLLFAGTDSSGMNLSTVFWHLARRPDVHARLAQELRDNPAATEDQLPYLRAVVKEGLRISMANPTRLPRVVGDRGLHFDGHFFPPGTSVGCTIYSMHFNEDVFPDAHAFSPERWLNGAATPEMNRDAIAFGLGARQCIARNLASVELHIAVRRVVESGVLEGARNVGRCADEIRIDEWFNSKVVGHQVEMAWKD